MRRPWFIWLLFGLCFAMVLAAMGWVSVMALRLDREKADADRQAVVEENVRLALWRMDSLLAGFIAEEGGRPYFAYSAFYPAERAYTRMFQKIEVGEVIVPSPLLMESSPYVVVHFQIDPAGTVTSPQVPDGNMRDLAEAGYTTGDRIDSAAARLAAVSGALNRNALLARLPLTAPEPPRLAQVTVPGQQAFLNAPIDIVQVGQGGQAGGQVGGQVGGQAGGQGGDQQSPPNDENFQRRQKAAQELRNSNEWANRARFQFDQQQKQGAKGVYAHADVTEGVMRGLWHDGMLLLARRVAVNGGQYVQGCRLDWPAVRAWLVGEVRDLLPGAALEPAPSPADRRLGRALAGLPVRLVPGALPIATNSWLSPIRASLILAWACVLVAAAAVAVLLRGAVVLSERRGAFVSAVTHEMRTPLTTFSMYTEMLSEGMVPESKRQEYVETLRSEADRLGHLVENVLAYARLENRPAAGRAEPIEVHALLDHVTDRLAKRAAQADMRLVVEAGAAVRSAAVRADAAAVEQILFNLVDNACKYAAAAEDRRIHLAVTVPGTPSGFLGPSPQTASTGGADADLAAGTTSGSDAGPQVRAGAASDWESSGQGVRNLPGKVPDTVPVPGTSSGFLGPSAGTPSADGADADLPAGTSASDSGSHVRAGTGNMRESSGQGVRNRPGRAPDTVAFRVCDHGPGIARGDERRLFRPFRKSAHDAARSAPGVGLGLALSRRLARDLGGSLRIDRTSPHGACFVLTLPTA